MNTRCPGCETRYEVDAEALFAANGMAHCLRCGTVFDAVSEQAFSMRDIAEEESSRLLPLDEHSEMSSGIPTNPDLPFDVPDDLEPLEPSDEGALDVVDTLYEKPSRHGVFYGLVASALVLALALQLAWQYRIELLQRFPRLEIICAYVSCRPGAVHAPDRYRVLQRDLHATSNEIGSLTLNATIRNDADAPQHLPDIQLSLVDDNGGVIIRRRLAPGDYLFPPPPDDRLVQPGEVFTIGIDFEDPGHIASGFTIDFF